MGHVLLVFGLTAAPIHADGVADRAIASFNAVCFRAGQTADTARARMQARDGTPLPYSLIFWDRTLEPAPQTAPALIERRCEVRFAGDHGDAAVAAVREQMAAPPVFGFEIDLPVTHEPTAATRLMEGRELLRGRVAVVHVGVGEGETFMAVDRLPADWEARL